MTIGQSVIINNKTYNVPRKDVRARLLFGMAWVISMIIFAAIQLLLGTDEKIVAVAFFSLLFCAIPVLLFGINDICTLFIFGLLAKYSFFPLWIKMFFGERIDIGLAAPLMTFEMALVGSILSCFALLLAKFIPVRYKLLSYRFNDMQMLLTGYLAIIFGLVFLILHVIFRPIILPNGVVTGGFGGFGSLVGPLYFGICAITVISFKTNSNPIHKFFLLIVFIVIIGLSFQTNAKTDFSLAVLTVALTILYFRIKIKAQLVVVFCLLAAFYIFIFVPVIHLSRTEAFKTADLPGKISILEDMFRYNSIMDLAGQSNDTFNYKYYPSTHTFLVDRLEMIQDIDIVAGGISRTNTVAWLPVRWAFESVLPRFIVHNKSNISDIDLIVYNAGYFPELITLNHTIGIFGSAYAMFLWPGLVFISLVVLFLYLLVLRVTVPPKLVYNSFGIFLLARHLFTFTEQSVQGLLGTILRTIPTDVVLILMIVFLANRICFFLPKKVNPNAESAPV